MSASQDNGTASGSDLSRPGKIKAWRLIPVDRRILEVLSEYYGGDYDYLAFRGLMAKTGLDRGKVRSACRRLRNKGLAAFGFGLWNDDGPAGSGYCCTMAGRRWVEATRATSAPSPTPGTTNNTPLSAEERGE
jgi:hypothetical protein